MAPSHTPLLSLPEPLESANQQDRKDHFSDLMPVEFGGLELSEPIKGNPDHGQQFLTVTTGDNSNCSTHVQSQERRESLICGIRKASFWLGLLCLVLLAGAIAASVIAGSKAKDLGLMEQSYKELQASVSSPCSPLSSSGNMSCISVPKQATPVPGEALPNCTSLTPREYKIPDFNITFIRECSTDYPEYDIGQVPLTTMEDCMNLCAALKISVQSASGPCIGVAWKTSGKVSDRQGEDYNFCYLKSKKDRRVKGGSVPTIESAWIKGAEKNKV